ncbi:hypothetical protein [Thalassobacillus sp. C254]|uniref:hypothetical protein n=1 Tax=Thalassobacillus sp. C254 TaxID=1225341 RepID=UPI0018DB049B|nr:hypothetical protein [Thalassobacillus sp. C254]
MLDDIIGVSWQRNLPKKYINLAFCLEVGGVKMDSQLKLEFEKSKSGDKNERYEAYLYILKVTDQKVDWAYEVWDQLLEDLTHKDSHQRSRAAQYLANLAISDPEMRIMKDFPKLWKVTYDEKFVTSRHF